MNSRKLIVSLVTAGALSVGLGSSLTAAPAQSTKCFVNGVSKGALTVEACRLLGGAIQVVPEPTSPPATTSEPPAQTSPSSSTPTSSPPSSSTTTTTSPDSQTSRPTPGPRPSNSRANRSKTRLGAHRVPNAEDLAAERAERQAKARGKDGTPTLDNPSYALSTPGPAPLGVPNFFIEKFRIPPFLLSIYQAAGIEYGVPWQVLAAINEIETDYGRNLNVSSAGAMGWMQFIPSSWKAYGVDANGDGRKDPYNPVDAIFAAARYLKAAGSDKDIRRAIFAYNHANWYVDSVMLRAKLIGGLPADLVGSLTGLTQAHFPVAARATYADDLSEREALKRAKGNIANPIEGSSTRRSINIYSKKGAPVIAVNDGIIKQVGENKRLGKFVVLQDVYGNNYTYSRLGKVAPSYPAPKPRPVSKEQIRAELDLPRPDPRPKRPASAGSQAPAPSPAGPAPQRSASAEVAKERLFAHPARPASYREGGAEQLLESGKPVAGYTTFEAYFKQVLGLKGEDVVLRKLKPGAQVIAGTILGRIDKVQETRAPHVQFEIRPAGKGAPQIDPKPILDGWKLLESTAIYRAAGKNPFFGPDAKYPSIGQLLLMSKEALERRVIADPRIEIYDCGRRDVQSGQIDRRVLATIAYLTASGLKPTVTSLKCGHSYLTSAGGVSAHSSGNAVDVAAVNGIPIIGNQGPGSITEITIRRLLNLQGTMKPNQIISLMKFPGTDNTLSLSDHHDHIHIGFQPLYGSNPKLARQFNAVLKPDQWAKLISRLNEIDNPVVPTKPSKAAIPVGKRSSRAHPGE